MKGKLHLIEEDLASDAWMHFSIADVPLWLAVWAVPS